MSIPAMPERGLMSNPNVARFLEKLRGLDVGSLAKLRRNAGLSLADSRSALPLFYRILPRRVVRTQDVEAYFLVATLYAVHTRPGGAGNLAATLASVSRMPGVNREGVDRRIALLIDANRDELPFRLRQAVRFVGSHDVPIDWERLLTDVLRWEHPDRPVQKAWARAYFASDQ